MPKKLSKTLKDEIADKDPKKVPAVKRGNDFKERKPTVSSSAKADLVLPI